VSNMESTHDGLRRLDFVCTGDIRYSLELDPFGESTPERVSFVRPAVTRGYAGATMRLHLVRIQWTVQYFAAFFYALVDLET
jgi:hypothetical protein